MDSINFTENEIFNFAKSNSVPRLITFGDDYVENIFVEHNPAMILFTEETD